MMLRQILDDDAGLGDGAVFRFVAQHRDLPDRPDLAVLRRLAEQVDGALLERHAALVERDQHLVAERRQRMEIQLQRHG
jgi:hypothetical protein